MPSVHPHKKDKDQHEETLINAVEVLAQELAGTRAKREHKEKKINHHNRTNHNSNDAPIESYLEQDRLVKEGRKARNDRERKENLNKQQEHHERLIKEIKTAYRDRSTTSRLKARGFRVQNIKDAAQNASSHAQAYIREANFLMRRLGNSLCSKNKIQHDIDGNFKSSNRFDIEANRLNAAADKAAETPIEDDD